MSFICFKCFKKFSSITYVKFHLKDTHNLMENNKNIFKCVKSRTCENIYYTYSGLRQHSIKYGSNSNILASNEMSNINLEMPENLRTDISNLNSVNIPNNDERNTVESANIFCQNIEMNQVENIETTKEKLITLTLFVTKYWP